MNDIVNEINTALKSTRKIDKSFRFHIKSMRDSLIKQYNAAEIRGDEMLMDVITHAAEGVNWQIFGEIERIQMRDAKY